MVSTSGAQLLPADAVSVLISKLLPLTTLLTPNVPEAELLVKESGGVVKSPLQSLDDLIHLAVQLKALGVQNVLLKGGHLPLDDTTESGNQEATRTDKKTIYNVLITKDDKKTVLKSEFLDCRNTHGTGCSLASK
jgi:hydroxymethylpyrimidine kinase/phosphomethylpyrimidine kinase